MTTNEGIDAAPIDVTTIEPISHDEAMVLAAVEYERFLDMVRSLDGDDWSRATDCEEWDVLQMAKHVVGAAEACASIRENVKQLRRGTKWAKVRSRAQVDGINAVQIDDRSGLSPAEVVRRLGEVVPSAVKGRRRVPRLLRERVKIPVEIPGISEKWPLGFLLDVIYTRDTWMHRVDIAQVTGHDLVLTPEHDGRLIADVVAEWARRHGRPFQLILRGPAGGVFVAGDEAARELFDLDAVEFTRIVAGRAPGNGLLNRKVAF